MNIEDLRLYALSFESVTEGFPFGEGTLVFKVQNKIFLLASLTAEPLQFNVKCDPDEAVLLREKYDAVQPGYHMNKKHWNTIIVDGTIPSSELKEFVKNSYDLVSKKKSGK
ncbi:MmcQ/YjbR family DNA-binding protein [soil metagenome]